MIVVAVPMTPSAVDIVPHLAHHAAAAIHSCIRGQAMNPRKSETISGPIPGTRVAWSRSTL